MTDDLAKLFAIQSNYVNLKTYQNEFESVRLVFNGIPEKPRKLMRELSVLMLQKWEQIEELQFNLKYEENMKEVIKLRQEGNENFIRKAGNRNVLGACRLYTDAIYAALDTKSSELPLVFANRAAALQNFGYYQQAYDDCVCARILSYPESLSHKIIMRQAYCSIKMKNLSRAAKHLDELRDSNLSSSFSKQFKELLSAFEDLTNKEVRQNLEEGSAIQTNRENQEIINTERGRCMQAKHFIEKNQLIFTERASAFVAVGNTRRMCHQCGTVNFIPIPCLKCRGRVNYCSLKCQEEHMTIHAYECPAYRMQLFSHVGIAHLALRIILDNGLFSILEELKNCHSANEAWNELTEGGNIWAVNSKQYCESLRMITHLDKLSRKEIVWYVLVCHQLVVYLKYYTRYFEDLNSANNNIDWELLTGSLILRHIGQCISNGHTLSTIIPQPLPLMTATEFHMLNENIWSSPWHVKLGYLHFFNNYDDVASANLPYLSLCNHSCVQQFQPKFSGRIVSTYALRDIRKGEEITNCYDVDYRKSKREMRRNRLQEIYHFQCRCENCLQTDNEDIEFNKFHQYRCDSEKCAQIFVSSTFETILINFFQNNLDNSENDLNLSCKTCNHRLNLKWLHEAEKLLSSFAEAKNRRRLYQIFKESEKYLVGFNKARCLFAQQLVYEWFIMFWTDIPFYFQDYCDLIEVLKYLLIVTKNRSSVTSTEYITNMLYLWDLLAKRKYKCSEEEMKEMLDALNVVADDLKVIFLNYYKDYIKEYLNL